MTARPHDERDALDPDERELAGRLSASTPPGPSEALDARILAAAHAAMATPASARRRRARRWPTFAGAAATLVVAVGLAWQLKPLIDMPPPLRERPAAPEADAEVLAHAEPAAKARPEAAPALADAAAEVPQPAKVAPAAQPRASRARSSAPAAPAAVAPAVASTSHDYLDEAVEAHAGAPAAAAVAASPAAPPPVEDATAMRNFVDPQARAAAESMDRVEVTGSRLRIGAPVAGDAALPPDEWLMRIRARRDAGDLEGARDSLRRFVREYPRLRLPDDLRALRAASP